jgi:hypothetical protein
MKNSLYVNEYDNVNEMDTGDFDHTLKFRFKHTERTFIHTTDLECYKQM